MVSKLTYSHSFLLNRSLCTFYKLYQTYKQHLPSFGAFCREVAIALSERSRSRRPLSTISENVETSTPTSTFEIGPSFVYKKRTTHLSVRTNTLKIKVTAAKDTKRALNVLSARFLYADQSAGVEEKLTFRSFMLIKSCRIRTTTLNNRNRPKQTKIELLRHYGSGRNRWMRQIIVRQAFVATEDSRIIGSSPFIICP
ncbi:hypothetical protein GQ600_1565 [Phytophthora cactorum]|nr:hypothetical protein GQ600_1565 [Phytophthora cactorum]